MMKQAYGYDINRIISLSNQQGNYHTESYALNLEDMLSNLQEMTPDMEKLINSTIDFLYGVVAD